MFFPLFFGHVMLNILPTPDVMFFESLHHPSARNKAKKTKTKPRLLQGQGGFLHHHCSEFLSLQVFQDLAVLATAKRLRNGLAKAAPFCRLFLSHVTHVLFLFLFGDRS